MSGSDMKNPPKRAYAAGLRGICAERCRSENYMPMHEVAPSAVRMAVATDAMICTMNLMVSFLVMVD